MSMRRLIGGALVVSILAAAAAGQPTITKTEPSKIPGQAPKTTGGVPVTPTPTGAPGANQPGGNAQGGAPAGVPAFEGLVKRDKDGKVVRLEGNLDIMALKRNPMINEDTWKAITPMIKGWMAEVDQVVVDNMDFIDAIEGGAIDRLDPNDMKNVKTIAEMMTQLMGAGPLSGFLEHQGGLDRQQSQINTQIVSEYYEAVLKELAGPGTDAAVVAKENMRFLYKLMCRDAMDSYHRQLDQAAPNIEKLVAGAGLSSDQLAKVKGHLAELKGAKTREARQAAMKAILGEMTFDQKRGVMQKALDMAPEFDPRAVPVS